MNKKGFVRTIEAVIAIVLIFIFIFTVMPREKQEQKVPDNIKLVQDKIIKEIGSNESLRTNVLLYPLLPEYDYTLEQLEGSDPRKNLNSFIKNSLTIPTIDFNYTVCDQNNQNCAPDFLKQGPEQLREDLPNKPIYAKSIMIANSTAERILRLYIWETF